jgi:hypothetical protein
MPWGELAERPKTLSRRLLARGLDEAPIEALLHAAADAVFGLMVQRELCGLRNQGDMIRCYAIPADVMSRVGIVRRD